MECTNTFIMQSNNKKQIYSNAAYKVPHKTCDIFKFMSERLHGQYKAFSVLKEYERNEGK